MWGLSWLAGCCLPLPSSDPVQAQMEQPPPAGPTVEHWPEGIGVDAGPVYVAHPALAGFGGLPEDLVPGLMLADGEGAWKEVPDGALLDLTTGAAVIGKARLREKKRLPYGCDNVEQDLVFFDVLAANGLASAEAVGALGEVVWLFPGDPTGLVPSDVELKWGGRGYEAHTRYGDVAVTRTGPRQGELRITNTGAPNPVSTAFPFEKSQMDGAEDDGLDLTDHDGDVGVPVLRAAFTRGDEHLLGFSVSSWEGVHYRVYALPDDGEPVLRGSRYRYICAF